MVGIFTSNIIVIPLKKISAQTVNRQGNNAVILSIQFYYVNSAVTEFLSQQPCNILWYMFTRVLSNVTVGRLVRWSRVAGSIPCRKVLKLYFSQLHAPGLVWKSRCHSTYMLPYRIFHLIYPSVNAKSLLLQKDYKRVLDALAISDRKLLVANVLFTRFA